MNTVTLIPTPKGLLSATIVGTVNIGNGGLTPSQQEKLDGIEVGATKNESDDWYAARINREVGLLSVPEITYEGTQITVGPATAFLLNSSAFTPNVGLGDPVELPETVLDIPVEQVPYYVVAYQPSVGEAVYVLETNKDLTARPNRAYVATVIRTGEVFHIALSDPTGLALAEKLERLVIARDGFKPLSGLGVSASDLVVTVDGGSAYFGATVKELEAAVSDVDGISFFTNNEGTYEFSSQSLANNFQYNGPDGLVELGNNCFNVNWFWRGVESQKHTYSLLSTQQFHSLSEAQNSLPPTPPQYVTEHAVFLGGIVYLNGTTEAAGYISPAVNGGGVAVSLHDNLGGIQGGLPDEKYHLSEDEYNYLRAWMAANPL